MSILIDKTTRVLIQGITGNEGAFHIQQMRNYGTNIVSGVTPGKGGQSFNGIPVFHTVHDAVQSTGANASAVFVPPQFAADAIMEAVDGGIELIVCMTEGIPTLDMIAVKEYMKSGAAKLLGPNTPGIISPGKAKIGVMAGYIHREGTIGVVSRSGTLTYEVVDQLSKFGIGQSSCAGIGGDPVIGLTFTDILGMFQDDVETEAVVIIGEIGGNAEEEAALFTRSRMKKPVFALIAGVTAPPGKRMGHAGAIISGGLGDAKSKIGILRESGVIVIDNPAEVGSTVAKHIAKKEK